MRALIALVLLALLPVLAHGVPAVSISLNPATGVAPYTSTLTWSVTGAATCTASDAWTGTKALTGSQSVTITAATKYTLTCSAADGQTITNWTPPATNTDGTPFTNPAGYNIYRGTTTTNLARIKSVGPAVTSYLDTGLATGNYYYALTTVNVDSQESVQGRATPYPIAVAGSSSSASAPATVQSIPNPPGGVTTVVTNATAYEIRPNSRGVMVASRIGLIPLGSVCSPETRTASGETYNRIDPSSVDLFNVPSQIPPRDVFAQCGPS